MEAVFWISRLRSYTDIHCATSTLFCPQFSRVSLSRLARFGNEETGLRMQSANENGQPQNC